jgi:hypothetical protein
MDTDLSRQCRIYAGGEAEQQQSGTPKDDGWMLTEMPGLATN